MFSLLRSGEIQLIGQECDDTEQIKLLVCLCLAVGGINYFVRVFCVTECVDWYKTPNPTLHCVEL